MTQRKPFNTFLGALLLCGSASAFSACELEAYPPNYGGGYDNTDDYPPPAYVATATPVYYEGRPAYWYHDRWYYRDGARGHWASYNREPAELGRRRVVAAPPARRYYGRPSVSRRVEVRTGRGGRRR